MKKAISILVALILLLSSNSPMLLISSADSYETALFPMQYLNISQGVNGSYSHQGCNALDLAGKDSGIDNAYSPFTGTIKRIYVDSYGGNCVWLQSNNKVYYADGTLDYMTILFIHDNDISDLYVGKVIRQGEIFFQEGTSGWATGNHIHMECGKGTFSGKGWYENSQGVWMINNSYLPYNALYLSDDTVVLDGYGYNWRRTSSPIPDPIIYTDLTPGDYRFKNKSTGRYLTQDGTYTQGSYSVPDVKNLTLNESANTQIWSIWKDSGGYAISPKSSDKLLNAWGDTPVSGNNLTLFANVTNGVDTQRWKFEEVSGGFVIRNCYNPNLVVTANGTDCIIQSYSGASTQIWTVESYSDKYNFDINITADGEYFAYGHDNVTFDVYINGSQVRNDYSDFSGDYSKGTTYTVNDIKVSGCYVNNGSSSYSGTINDNVNVIIPIVTSHTPTTVAGYAATCTEAGKTDGSKCSKCGITLTAQKTIAALGHNYVAETVAGTCTSPQKIIYTCSRCGDSYEIEGGWSDWSTELPPDGFQSESKTQYRYSDYETKDSYNSSETGWEPNGSDWQVSGSGSTDYVASWPSGFDKTHSLYNQYKTVPSNSETTTTKRTYASSSSTVGYIYWHWCRGDNAGINDGNWNRYYSFESGYDSSTGVTFSTFHAFMSTSPVSLVTNSTGADYQSKREDVCGSTYWWAGSLMENTYAEHNLTVQRKNYTDYKKLFHYYRWTDYSAWQDSVVASSSTRRVETRTLYRYYVNPAPDGHNWNEGVVTVAPTCAAEGVMTYTCTVCQETRTESIAKLTEHTWNDGVVTTEPTCAAEGIKTFTCTVCGETKTESIEVLEHTWNDGVESSAPTCAVEGVMTFTCTACGATKTESIDKLTVHTWDEGVVTVEPTHVSEGVRTYACTVCGETKTEPIGVIEHTWDDGVVTFEPTCVDEGVITYTCTVCGEAKTETISKLTEHTWNSGEITLEPTHTTPGEKTFTCVVCGATKTEPIPIPDPADPDAVITVANVKAYPGDTVNVSVDLSEYAPMSYLLLGLDYDFSILTLERVNNGELFDTYEFGKNLLMNSGDDITNGGCILTLTFTVNENAEPGEYVVTVICKQCYNNEEDSLFVKVENGVITIPSVILGDINGDNVIDGRDLIRLRKYLANLNEETGECSIEIVAEATDVTGDGYIDGRDLIRLRKYLANLDEDTGISTITLG